MATLLPTNIMATLLPVRPIPHTAVVYPAVVVVPYPY